MHYAYENSEQNKEMESGWPPKSNRLVTGPHPTLLKIRQNLFVTFFRYFCTRTHRQTATQPEHNLLDGGN